MRQSWRTAGGIFIAATLGLISPALAEDVAVQSSPVLELRQYTLKEGQREILVDLIEQELIEPQEELGLKILGTFRDIDRPDRLVWLRGFSDMKSRGDKLERFYSSPAWKSHRQAANATIVDSDNVLLLRAPSDRSQFKVARDRPSADSKAPAGLVVATIGYLKSPASEALHRFEHQVKPELEAAGIPVDAWFVTETSPNNFPKLPVREKENVLVWFTHFKDSAAHAARVSDIKQAMKPLRPSLASEPELLRLQPTNRSLIRGFDPAGT